MYDGLVVCACVVDCVRVCGCAWLLVVWGALCGCVLVCVVVRDCVVVCMGIRVLECVHV